MRILAGAVGMLWLVAGCSSDWEPGPVIEWYDISGRYVSEAEVGGLGTLTIVVELVEDTHVFAIELTGTGLAELEPVEGVSTLGDNHVIMDFELGSDSDYYFEGTVTRVGEVIESISGQFIWPDQAETLLVTFLPD